MADNITPLTSLPTNSQSIPSVEVDNSGAPAYLVVKPDTNALQAPPAHLIDEARRRHRELGYALERLRRAPADATVDQAAPLRAEREGLALALALLADAAENALLKFECGKDPDRWVPWLKNEAAAARAVLSALKPPVPLTTDDPPSA